MLTIRLQRAGKKNKPEYRVVLAEKTAASQKKFIEVLGSYNPHSKTLGIRDQERLSYWIGQHVEVSPTVHNLLITKQIITGDKVKAFTLPKKEAVAEEAAPVADAAGLVTEEAVSETPAEVPTETPAEVPLEPAATPETPIEPQA